MDNNFSTQVKEIISFSREEALRLGNDYIDTGHLLLGLIKAGDNEGVDILKSFNVDLSELQKEVELAIKGQTGCPDKSGLKVSRKQFFHQTRLAVTKQAEKVIHETVSEAKALKSRKVETDHLMLSILKNRENMAYSIICILR